MDHTGGRHQFPDPVHHAQPGAQDRNQSDPFTDLIRFHFHQRSLDLFFPQRQIPGRFITQQCTQLTDQLTEFFRARIFIAKDGELMLDQRMV